MGYKFDNLERRMIEKDDISNFIQQVNKIYDENHSVKDFVLITSNPDVLNAFNKISNNRNNHNYL